VRSIISHAYLTLSRAPVNSKPCKPNSNKDRKGKTYLFPSCSQYSTCDCRVRIEHLEQGHGWKNCPNKLYNLCSDDLRAVGKVRSHQHAPGSSLKIYAHLFRKATSKTLLDVISNCEIIKVTSQTYLKNAANINAMSKLEFEAAAALLALYSPSRFPILRKHKPGLVRCKERHLPNRCSDPEGIWCLESSRC